MPSLPTFRYHPDPVRTGSVESWTGTCDICHEARGYRYTGPVYSEKDGEPDVCPWCIADGSAAKKLRADFVDCEAFGEGIPDPAVSLPHRPHLTR